MNKMRLNIQLFGGSCSIGTITETTTGADTNQSIFSIPATLSRTGSTHNNDNAYMTMQWKYASASSWTTISKQTFGLPTSKTSVTKTWSLTLTHADNGTLENVQFRVQWYITDSTKGTTGATTFTPTTIPRASVPTLNYSSRQFGEQVIISTNRYSSSFTHTLEYTFAGSSGTIATNVGASYTWTIPNNLMNNIPNATSGTCTIICKTYNGSTLIGSKNVSLILNVPSGITPAISYKYPSLQEMGSTPSNWNTWVQGKSKVGMTFYASGSYGSTISSFRSTLDGYTYSISKNSNNEYPFISNYLNNVGTFSLVSVATDSRGRTHTDTWSNIQVVAYSNPTISTAQVQRCDASGNIDNNGEYMYISYGASISSCSGNNTSYAVYKVGYRVHGTGNYTYVDLTTNANSYSASGMLFSNGIKAASSSGTKVQFSTNNTYDIIFYAQDYFNPNGITNVQLLDSGFDLMNFNPSGKAMAIGKVSEAGANEELLEIGMNTTIDGTLNVVREVISPSANQYSGLVIKSSNYNEASITYRKASDATKEYVVGYGTMSYDGFGVYSREKGNNVLTVDKNGAFQTGTIRNMFLANSTSGTSGVYVKLCKIVYSSHQQGAFTGMRIYLSNGNNGGNYQNAFINLTLQLGWTGSRDGRFGGSFELHPLNTSFNLSNVNVIVIANSNIDYDVYLWTSLTYCRPSYVVDANELVTITPYYATSTTAPSGTQIEMSGSIVINNAVSSGTGTLNTTNIASGYVRYYQYGKTVTLYIQDIATKINLTSRQVICTDLPSSAQWGMFVGYTNRNTKPIYLYISGGTLYVEGSNSALNTSDRLQGIITYVTS